MDHTHQQRLKEVLAAIDGQRGKIQRLHTEYYTGYDAAFDENGALASLQRWCDRTLKLINDQVGATEAAKFRRAGSGAPRGRGSWHWGELCQYFDTYLVRLIEDIQENPNDPSFENLLAPPAAAPQPAPSTSDIQRYDVFLSYSTQDKDEARQIHDALTRVGKNCFIAEKSLQPGDKFQDEIRASLRASAELWILVSPRSIQSAWVQREVSAAWALHKRIVPILLQCSPGDLPEILADTHAIDFHKVHAHIKRLG
jgi:hypothetical protein